MPTLTRTETAPVPAVDASLEVSARAEILDPAAERRESIRDWVGTIGFVVLASAVFYAGGHVLAVAR